MVPNKKNNVRFAIGSLLLVMAALTAGIAMPAHLTLTSQAVAEAMGFPDETDHKAPVDYGAGPGVKPQAQNARVSGSLRFPASAAARLATPSGDASAGTMGVFGAPVTWPLVAIHAILLSDGRVMSYGTSSTGAQGAQLIYDVWDPSLGTDTSAHFVLPNSTGTDIFCSAQSLMLSGEVLTSGGDLTVNGARNSANNNTTIFSPSANTLTANTPMTYARWYGTLVGLPDGQLAIFGGRQNVGSLSPVVSATTPELYDPATRTWTSLTGATSTAAFGANWWYPRALVAPGGKIFVLLSTNGKMFYLSTANGGSIALSTVTAPAGNIALPTVSFAPGKVLSVRQNQTVIVVDYTAPTPVVTPTDSIDAVRYWSNGTVLADGQVFVNGGSAADNKEGGTHAETGVQYQTQIWNPQTGHWTTGASAAKPRLYHSTALLLPDATVLTGGGGAPGPVTNLNAEIYYPPYLYAADGTPALRPSLLSTDLSSYDPGAILNATVGAADVIARLTLVRTGSATHSYNADQRFIELNFTQSGQNLSAQLPGDNSILVPGSYMLFALNPAGVPSVAKFIAITATPPPPPDFTVTPASLAFGVVQVGTSSTAQAVTVTNNGGTLPVSSIGFSGIGASKFSQTNTCGNSIPAGGSCTINVVFRPTAAGGTTATLSVTGSGVTKTATVTGTGSVPFTVSPATLSFGNQVAVGTSSAPQALTVSNIGSAPLPVSSITMTGSTSQFSQTNNCGTPVPAGGSCTINMVFSPSATGYVFVKVFVASPGATHSSTVSGTGK
jgi:hypothetical protein